MAEFRLVFRQACDHGEKRNLPTPELEEMLQNLDAMLTDGRMSKAMEKE